MRAERVIARRRALGALLWRDLRLDLSYRLPFALDAIGLVSVVAIFFYIGRYTGAKAPEGGVEFFAFVLAGIALLRMQAGLLRTIASLDREQASGTLELVLAGPLRPAALVLGSALYGILRELIFAVGAIAVGRWLFGAGLTLGPRAWAALAVGLVAAAVFFLALTGATAAVLISFKHGVPLANVLALVLPILSGAYFATSALPQPVETLTQVVPLTLAIELVRTGVLHATFSWPKALLTLMATGVCVPMSMFVVELAVARARRLGTLGQY
jgi:ABC-type polysaccharide/polyol phosphate export permease